MNFAGLHKLHKRLWAWLAITGARNKFDWPDWEDNGGTDTPTGFACDYDDMFMGNCSHCPIDWKGGDYCKNPKSEYSHWILAETKRTRKKWAAIIRDLPWSNRRHTCTKYGVV
jgi:hypothetical protein